jgi:endonuclease G, mitochondrial
MPTPSFLPTSGARLPQRFLHTGPLRDEVIANLQKAKPAAADRLAAGSLLKMASEHTLHAPITWPAATGVRPIRFPAVKLPLEPDGPGTLAIIRDFDPAQLYAGPNMRLETIVKELARPSFLVKNDATDFTPRSELPVATLTYWRDRLQPHANTLKAIYESVGRIELHNHETLAWCGTGWLLRPNVLVTNRHVARAFAESAPGSKWQFRKNIVGRDISANVDYTEESGDRPEDPHRITEVLYLHENGPDVAFLRVEANKPRGLAGAGIPLAAVGAIQTAREVLTIGYARYDSSMPEPGDMVERVFGYEFNVKRAAPGAVMAVVSDKSYLTHDCSTLGGNSGSVVVDFESGAALGLHMGGNFREENYAVTADFLRDQLEAQHLM